MKDRRIGYRRESAGNYPFFEVICTYFCSSEVKSQDMKLIIYPHLLSTWRMSVA